MRINSRVQAAVLAIAVLSVGLSTLSAEAKPKKGDRYEREYYEKSYGRDEDRWKSDRRRSRYDDDRRYDSRYDDDDDNWRRNRSRTVYYRPGSRHSRLPSRSRKVVIRQRTYYTPDNNVFFTYSPARNIYIVVDNPFRFF
ncbi:MAG: hypothetical protein MH252_19915 [Thermosynechococcaceae cyanobacterium MS004]|nr:hypothetical protein [Thermosynechococcaceae cyanobacterium MS004]